MRRVHPDVALVGTALVGIALLAGLTVWLAPPEVALADVPEHEGARVALVARVLDVREGAHGRWFMLADATHRMSALAGPGSGPARGDVVRVVGIVTPMDAGWGVSAESVVVVERAASRAVSPTELARAPGAFDGARVLVAGELRDGALRDGDARVRLTGAPSPGAGGGWWRVVGTFEYRASEAAYVLRAESWVET